MTDKDATIATYVLEDSASGPLVKDAIGGIRAATACEIEQYKINRRLREENEALRNRLKRIEPFAWHFAHCGLQTGLGFECSCGMAYECREAKAALAAGAGDSVSVQGKETGE